jgi:hypothetical protein
MGCSPFGKGVNTGYLEVLFFLLAPLNGVTDVVTDPSFI